MECRGEENRGEQRDNNEAAFRASGPRNSKGPK